jgi:hypothetical protein
MVWVFNALEPPPLLQSIQQPDPDAKEESEQEIAEAITLKAMEDVAVTS